MAAKKAGTTPFAEEAVTPQPDEIAKMWVETEARFAVVFKVANSRVVEDRDVNALKLAGLYMVYLTTLAELTYRARKIGEKQIDGGKARRRVLPSDQDAALLAAACSILSKGGSTRGINGRVKRRTKDPRSEKQIGRVLDRWMPDLLTKIRQDVAVEEKADKDS